jgi:hypothetical protein
MRAAVTRSEGLGIHIEDDVLITARRAKGVIGRRAADGERHRSVDGDNALVLDAFALQTLIARR